MSKPRYNIIRIFNDSNFCAMHSRIFSSQDLNTSLWLNSGLEPILKFNNSNMYKGGISLGKTSPENQFLRLE